MASTASNNDKNIRLPSYYFGNECKEMFSQAKLTGTVRKTVDKYFKLIPSLSCIIKKLSNPEFYGEVTEREKNIIHFSRLRNVPVAIVGGVASKNFQKLRKHEFFKLMVVAEVWDALEASLKESGGKFRCTVQDAFEVVSKKLLIGDRTVKRIFEKREKSKGFAASVHKNKSMMSKPTIKQFMRRNCH